MQVDFGHGFTVSNSSLRRRQEHLRTLKDWQLQWSNDMAALSVTEDWQWRMSLCMLHCKYPVNIRIPRVRDGPCYWQCNHQWWVLGRKRWSLWKKLSNLEKDSINKICSVSDLDLLKERLTMQDGCRQSCIVSNIHFDKTMTLILASPSLLKTGRLTMQDFYRHGSTVSNMSLDRIVWCSVLATDFVKNGRLTMQVYFWPGCTVSNISLDSSLVLGVGYSLY